jgi:hypothetical protein
MGFVRADRRPIATRRQPRFLFVGLPLSRAQEIEGMLLPTRVRISDRMMIKR